MRHLDEGTLQAWLDRDRSGLDAATRTEIEDHLATCEACRSRLDALEESDRRARAIFSSAEPTDPSIPDFEGVVERSRSRSRKPRRSAWLTTAWAASLVGAIAAGWATNELYRSGTPPPAATVASESTQPPSAVPAEAVRGGSNPAAGRAVGAPTAPDRETIGEPEAAAPSESPGGEEARLEVEVPATTFEAPSPTGSPDAVESDAAEVPEERMMARAEQSGEPLVLTGRVTDERGRPVPSAQVFVPGSGAGTLTDRDGDFTLTVDPGLEADDGLQVAVERIGFARATIPVDGDSLADAAGAVSTDVRLRDESVALAEVVVTGATEAGEGWTSMDRERAEELAGFSILSVPGMEILEIDVTELDGTPVVRVRQALGSNGVLTLLESLDPVSGPAVGLASLPPDSTVTTVTTRREEVWITASGPMAADSVRVLLGGVR